jgi:hypothetical protein
MIAARAIRVLCIPISSCLVTHPSTHDVFVAVIVCPPTNHKTAVAAFAPAPSAFAIPIAVTPVAVAIVVAISTIPTLG